MKARVPKLSLLLIVVSVLLSIQPTIAFAAGDTTFDGNSLILFAIALGVFLVALTLLVLDSKT